MKKILIALIIVFIFISKLYADIYYVHPNGDDANNGESWAEAFATLQRALNSSFSNDEIWVAAGTYYPTSDYQLDIGPRGMHFRMKNGVEIYGGFPTTGDPIMDDRDWVLNKTILSGDIGIKGNKNDNCYHVFYHPEGYSLSSSAILDGFIITGGNANGIFPHWNGGGIHNWNISPIIRNCTFTRNYASNGGAGVYNNRGTPQVINCTFTYNSAPAGGGIYNIAPGNPTVMGCTFIRNSASNGGGIYNGTDGATVENCTFINNSAARGGGIFNIGFGSEYHITNSLIVQNHARSNGGGLYNNLCTVNINNCTIAANTANSNGGGIANVLLGNSIVNNSIIWNNSAPNANQIYLFQFGECTLNYSCYMSGDNQIDEDDGTFTATNNNISDNPLFMLIGEHPYKIMGHSTCVNTGDNNLIPLGITTDLVENPRIFNTTVDMGAYEFPFSATGIVNIEDVCVDSEIELLEGIDFDFEGGSGNYTYSWSPSYLIKHDNTAEPQATLLRAIRSHTYQLGVYDNELEYITKLPFSLTVVPKVNIQSTITHRYKYNELTAPIDLHTLIDEPEDLENYNIEWIDRFTDETFDDADAYMPEPNSSLYLWLILYDTETDCEVGRRRMNIIVR